MAFWETILRNNKTRSSRKNYDKSNKNLPRLNYINKQMKYNICNYPTFQYFAILSQSNNPCTELKPLLKPKDTPQEPEKFEPLDSGKHNVLVDHIYKFEVLSGLPSNQNFQGPNLEFQAIFELFLSYS